jgi:mercuric reductase
MWGGSDCDVLLAHLRGKDLLVLDELGAIAGAYPFTTEKTPHCLTVNGQRVHAMCALDALAISPLFGLEVQIDSRCAASNAAIHIHQRGLKLLEVKPSNDLLLGIHWQQTAGCAAHSLCREMVFLKNLEAAMKWQGLAPETRELYDLEEAVQLAAGFFKPLLHDET